MRVVVIDRTLLGAEPPAGFGARSFDVRRAHTILDAHDLPDGFPFVIDDDGGLAGCRRLNQYLVDAYSQRAFDLRSMREFHIYHLARLLRYLRRSRAQQLAESQGLSAEDWLDIHGEPALDLTDARREDLVGYRDSRQLSVEPGTLKTEIGCLSTFFNYATASGWMPANPVPRWGGRNTLMPRQHKVRQARFLTASQTQHFLSAGLRGEGCGRESRPACPQRDFVYGLLLATSGLRREECALLLDAEIPSWNEMHADGVHVFDRIGKKGVTRAVYTTLEAVAAIDFYRQTERVAAVSRHQPSLRRLRRQGRLFLVDKVGRHTGNPDGHRQRARAPR